MSVTLIPPSDFDQPSEPEHEVLIAYTNIGNEPLVAGDFVSPITTDFFHSRVKGAMEFVPAFARNAAAEIDHSGTTGFVKPHLLNPDETVRVAYRVLEFAHNVRVHGRIIGVPNIKNISLSDILRSRINVLLTFYACFILVRVQVKESVETGLFLLLALPFVVFSLIDIVRIHRQQCLSWMFKPGPP